MRREWQDGQRSNDEPDSPVPAPRVASSLTGPRLLVAGVVLALGLLTIGVAVSSMLPPPTEAAAPGAAPEVAGAVEIAPGDDAVPEVEIDDAVAAQRNGPLVPAAVEHLTVVQVSVSSCGLRSVGSGVVIADGLVLTAAHVVGDAGLVRVDHRGVTVTGEVIGVLGDGRDVALVRVDAPMAERLTPAPAPRLGEPVTLVGHPDGGPRTVLVGEAVAVAPAVALLAGGGEIVGVDASIAQGISGGPAVDAAGRLLGLVVAKEEATDTALIVALPDLAEIERAALVPGECRAGA